MRVCGACFVQFRCHHSWRGVMLDGVEGLRLCVGVTCVVRHIVINRTCSDRSSRVHWCISLRVDSMRVHRKRGHRLCRASIAARALSAATRNVASDTLSRVGRLQPLYSHMHSTGVLPWHGERPDHCPHPMLVPELQSESSAVIACERAKQSLKLATAPEEVPGA